MATLFFSYSHADEALRNELENHLASLKHEGLLESWHDRRIPPGNVVDDEINENLETADIILLLVSSDFLASNYCYNREMKRALQRADDKSARVIPVILRPCDWHHTPFGKLLAVPRDGRAITMWPNRDEAFLDVVKAIRGALPKLQTVSESAAISTFRNSEAKRVIEPRSSNLRIKQEFTKLDQDNFLQDGFEYLAKFFENSLKELVDRNPSVKPNFRRIDANRFTAAAYRNGDKICHCSVTLGSESWAGTTGISYSYDEHGSRGSFNEQMSVGSDKQKLFFKPLGMHYRSNEKEKLSFEGMAEYFWAMFLDPLQ